MTRWVEAGINKYHICDLEQKGGITAPMDDAGWGTLANLVAKLVEAKKLSVKANKKGDAHGTMMAKHMREAVERDDPTKMGEFMGCMMWMMETPQMNRSMVPNRSSSQGFEYVWNSSTILCRVLPKVAPVVEPAEEPIAAPAPRKKVAKRRRSRSNRSASRSRSRSRPWPRPLQLPIRDGSHMVPCDSGHAFGLL